MEGIVFTCDKEMITLEMLIILHSAPIRIGGQPVDIHINIYLIITGGQSYLILLNSTVTNTFSKVYAQIS